MDIVFINNAHTVSIKALIFDSSLSLTLILNCFSISSLIELLIRVRSCVKPTRRIGCLALFVELTQRIHSIRKLDADVLTAAEYDPGSAMDIALQAIRLLTSDACLPWSCR